MDKTVNLEPIHFLYLMFGFAGTFAFIWLVFWFVVWSSKTSPIAIINSSKFLQILTVSFTLFAVLILSLFRILSGELAGAIISGVVGYVLGSNRASSAKPKRLDKLNPGAPKELPPNQD